LLTTSLTKTNKIKTLNAVAKLLLKRDISVNSLKSSLKSGKCRSALQLGKGSIWMKFKSVNGIGMNARREILIQVEEMDNLKNQLYQNMCTKRMQEKEKPNSRQK